MAFGYPSGTNTFVPTFEASGHLTVMFSRNPKDFALNRYISLTPVKKGAGYFLRITPEVAARVINTGLNEFVWNDGQEAPTGDWQDESFSFFSFQTQRYVYPFRLGYKTEEQADWKILAAHSEIAAQLAMTARTVKVLSVATTTSNYDSDKNTTAASLVGNFLNTGSPTNPIFKQALNSMARTIHQATLGAVKPGDMVAVMNPTLADNLSRSQEIHTYIKESPAAWGQVTGDKLNYNQAWGLPETLYGYKIVVEDTVQVTSKKGATRATQYALPDNTMLFLARPGGLTSMAGGPSFSSIHTFNYEEMTVEQKDDPDNRRIKGRVVEDFDVQMVSPASSFIVTHCLS